MLTYPRFASLVTPRPPFAYVPNFYGTALAGEDLQNTPVGGPDNTQVSYRFLAEQSSALDSIKVYVITYDDTHGGYAGGDFKGVLRARIYADDGTSNHFPNTGVTLATSDDLIPDAWGSGTKFPTFTFPSPASLVAGTIYHLVFTNVHASPTINFSSLDGLYVGSVFTPQQPRWADSDFIQLQKDGAGAWRVRTDLTVTPIVDLAYANGSHQGQGYMETWGRGNSDGYITCNGTIKFRETITVSGADRTVSGVWVRLARVSGSGALTVRFETGAGVPIESKDIAAASIAVAPKGGANDPVNNHGEGQRWYLAQFAANRTLTSGSSYNIVLSCPSGSEYWCTAMAQGDAYGFNSATYFTDGRAQIATNGTTWTDVKNLSGVASPRGDIGFYFSIV